MPIEPILDPHQETVFPTVLWNESIVTFEAIVERLDPSISPAVVIFARSSGGYVLANIRERGWCTPSGRLEPGESHLEAALRETQEEIGGRLELATEIGRYVLQGEDGRTLRFPAYLGLVREFGDIPAGSESSAARCITFNALSTVYYRWDKLIERVFEFAERSAPTNLEI